MAAIFAGGNGETNNLFYPAQRLNFFSNKEKEMKKVFLKGALAAMGIGMLAGSAQAASVAVYPGGAAVGTNAGTNVFYLANEAYDTSAGTAVTGGGDFVVLTNANNLPSDLTVSMTNGQIANATAGYGLAAWVDANSDGIVALAETTVVADDAAAKVVGTVSNGVLTFSGANYINVAPGTKLLILDSADSVGANIGALASISLNWLLPGSLDADASVTMSAVESKGSVNEHSGSAPFATLMNQYVYCTNSNTLMDGQADLGVTPVGATFTTANPLVTQDTAVYGLVDRNVVNTSAAVGHPCQESMNYAGRFISTQAAGGGSVDDVDYSLVASDSQVTAMKSGANQSVAYASGAWTQDGLEVNSAVTFVATVNGTESIALRNFDIAIESVPVNSDFNKITYAATGGEEPNAGAWTSQGYVGRVPYMLFGYTGYSCFLKVNNMHATTEGEISFSAQVANQTDGTDTTVTGSLGTVAPETLAHIGKADIAAALGLDAAKEYHVALTLSIGVPNTVVDVAGFQSSPTGRTDLPLYIVNGVNQ